MGRLIKFLLKFLLLSSSISFSMALSFNFTSFESPKTSDLTLNGDAGVAGAGLDLNRDAIRSAGRALYRKSIQLWATEDHGNTAVLVDFNTHFACDVFSTFSSSNSADGGGFSFVMVPDEDASWSPSSYGGLLGLFNSNASALAGDAGQLRPVVAVEFDEGLDLAWDFSPHHVGIDVNSLKSKRYVNLTAGGFINMGRVEVWVDYNSTSKNLSVSFSLAGNLGSVGVFHIVDLRDVLPQRVQVGFTASTGSSSIVIHRITSWSFTSPDLTIPSGHLNIGKLMGVCVLLVLFIILLGWGIVICVRRRSMLPTIDRDILLGNRARSDEFRPEDLPTFGVEEASYELIRARTNNFGLESRIGRGGSGEVFRCRYGNPERDVAVKKIEVGSSPRRRKDFTAEIAAVSQARHKNLIRLLYRSYGDDNNLLLIFEFMPNGSFYKHLHTPGPVLPWKTRCDIILDVARGLRYLHKDLKPLFLVHRDIKSSNVLLDQDFKAKLADFGAARFVELSQEMGTTQLCGTRGYLDPKLFNEMKASPMSDVYSFGMLIQEAVTGYYPPLVQNLLSLVRNQNNTLANLVDRRLGTDFVPVEAERLLAIGLLCCNDDPYERPTISKVIPMLKGRFAPPNMPLYPPSAGQSFSSAAVALAPAPALGPADAPPSAAVAPAPATALGPDDAPPSAPALVFASTPPASVMFGCMIQ